MSTIPSTPKRGLFGRTRSALLALLFGHADKSFYLRQLIRTVGAGHGALQREIKQLTDMGLIVRRAQGNQVLYRANQQSPIFPEIKRLITKTVGVHDAIRSALATLGPEIEAAFVYGSVASQREQANSDVDLMVVGKASFSDVVTALSPAQKTLRREINPTVFPISEFRSKLDAGNHFLRSVMADKKVFVLGNEDELAKLVAKQVAGPAQIQRRRNSQSIRPL
jgi:predicted nucleotidyltransferase